MVERSICVHGGWRWNHLCGEEKRTRFGDWKRGEEEIREVEKMRGGEDERWRR